MKVLFGFTLSNVLKEKVLRFSLLEILFVFLTFLIHIHTFKNDAEVVSSVVWELGKQFFS